jgi:ubiquinone biosynthesis UbiH/UbiF/VisC/COQ6 family hydroxylase
VSAAQDFDVLIIGAGPAGLCCARRLSANGLSVGLVERQDERAIAEPEFDGREIALTHRSLQLLKALGVWSRMEPDAIAPLKDAAVMNSGSRQRLFFDHREARCEALGFLVPNHVIRAAAYRAVHDDSGVRLLCGRQVSGMERQDVVRVHTAQGETLRGRLLIGADSRFSDVRRAVGIAADMLDFGRTMLVCRMQHEIAHEQTAWEWFQERCTVALLPLRGRESSIVITVPNAEAQRLCAQEASEFNRDITARFEERLGAMQLSSTRHVYPLVATYSRQFVAARCALIGDAAVGMHPVTAHGFNLGLQSLDSLARELQRAATLGIDIGAAPALERYQAAHRRNSRALYLGTNAIVRLYSAAAVVQRRPARRQPGADRADGRRPQAAHVRHAGEIGFKEIEVGFPPPRRPISTSCARSSSAT